MSRESLIIQELVNGFPSWSKIRSEIDSNGQRLLNPTGKSLEKLEKSLIKIDKNVHLSTFNLDEIDQLFKISLATDFSFTENYDGNNISSYTPPTSITGDLGNSITMVFSDEDASGNTSSSFTVNINEDGEVKSFWEDSLPNAFERTGSIAITAGFPAIKTMIDLDALSPIEHPLRTINGGGKFYFELTAKQPYIRKEDGVIFRSRIVLSGETRKGLLEEETIVFPWKGVVSSRKDWARIDSITSFDIEDIDSSTSASLKIRIDNCLQDDYMSGTNLKWSKDRSKIDEFWKVNTSENLLERLEYSVDNWKLILKGVGEKLPKDRWHLLDGSDNSLTGVKDMQLVPFKEQAWVLAGNKIYLYDLDKELNTQIDYVKDNATKNSSADIILDTEDVIVGENLIYSLVYKRSLQDITSYSLWYIPPGSTSKTYEVGTSSQEVTNYNEGRILLTKELAITAKGEYIFGADITLEDNTTETIARLVTIKSKKPLKSFDLSGLSISNSDGLFFDADQKLWVRTNTHYYRIKFYRNTALVDYRRKNIYFLEKYESLTVNYP